MSEATGEVKTRARRHHRAVMKTCRVCGQATWSTLVADSGVGEIVIGRADGCVCIDVGHCRRWSDVEREARAISKSSGSANA